MSASVLRRLLLLAALILVPQGCSDSSNPAEPDPDPDPDPGSRGQVNSYLTGVSNWPEPPDSVPPTPTGEAQVSRTMVDSVSVVDTTGAVSWNYDVEYVCTTQPYTFAETPEKIVMLSPDRDILWPGALLQGRSHADGGGGPGSLDVLPIGQRAALQISIPDLPTGSNVRTVEVVTGPNVESARGSIIGEAMAQNLFSPASDDFEVETYNSEAEFALKTKLSGRYLNFSGSASGSVNRTTSETTIAVRYIQKLYEVVVPPPQTPGDFFSDEFTDARLQEQVDLGRIGPDNQPIYVANIVYGRMMMFTLTAEASASELSAIVNASYQGLVGGAEASLSARQKSILSSSKVALSTYGGGRDGTQAMIRSGDWREYFTQEVRLSDAVPLSYTFRTLTGEVAAVQEATDYEVETCQPLGDTPLEYPFDGAAQEIGSPVPNPFNSFLGDVTGDGIQDLILNHLSPSQNVVAVLPGDASGNFGAPVISESSVTPDGGWANYTLLVGNVDGDAAGTDDLVWSGAGLATTTVNRVYVGLSDGSGSLDFLDEQVHPAENWGAGWKPKLLDLNGDGRKDLAWNILNSSNLTWMALANDDGTFDMSGSVASASVSGWTTYDAFVGDVDRDGDEDFIWNSVRSSQPNRTYVGRLNGSSLSIPAGNDHPAICCWTAYKRVVGDFDGDQRTDILFFNPTSRAAHRGYSNAFDSWTFPAYQSLGEIPSSSQWEVQAGDFNGDGVDDFVVNRREAENEVWVTLGRPNRTFGAPRRQEDHPANATWTNVRGLLVGDITGEGRADLVWVVPGATTRVYVGLGRQQ